MAVCFLAVPSESHTDESGFLGLGTFLGLGAASDGFLAAVRTTKHPQCPQCYVNS